VEFKYVKAKEHSAPIELRKQEAASQLRRYAESEAVKSAIGSTFLHQIVIVYHGMDMVVCDELPCN
jgi:hypothetical protein